MPKIYFGYEENGSRDGLGKVKSGGGTIQEFTNLKDISTNTAVNSVTTVLDFSNGITYNSKTGQWIGAISRDGFYIYDSLDDMVSNTNAERIPYRAWVSNFNNGFTYHAENDTYYTAFYYHKRMHVEQFKTLQDAAGRTGRIGSVQFGGSGVNFTNGIEYDATTGTWYGASHGGDGALVGYPSLNDMLKNTNGTTYKYNSADIDYEMGIAIAPCFVRGTLIQAETGLITVENLIEGDLIKTHDNGYQPIRWIGSRKISVNELIEAPSLRPIRILAGALAPHSPDQDLLVSPQHRILVRSEIAQRMFDAREILIAAKQLLELDGIEVVEDDVDIEYFHILFDRHQVVFSNGALTESFYPGKQALKSVGAAAQQEVFQLFPELKDQDACSAPESARILVPGRAGRNLVRRHVKNNRNLIAP